MKTVLVVKGFHCKSCKILVEDLCEDYPQISSCTVDIENAKLILEHQQSLNLKDFIAELESLGDYEVTKL